MPNRAMRPHLRLLLARAGLPEPALNTWVPVEGGRWRVDLLYPRHGVIVEYDGERHRTDDIQWDKDHVRLDSLRAAGWSVLTVRRHGLYGEPTATVARIRSALMRAAGPPPHR